MAANMGRGREVGDGAGAGDEDGLYDVTVRGDDEEIVDANAEEELVAAPAVAEAAAAAAADAGARAIASTRACEACEGWWGWDRRGR